MPAAYLTLEVPQGIAMFRKPFLNGVMWLNRQVTKDDNVHSSNGMLHKDPRKTFDSWVLFIQLSNEIE